MLTRDLVERIFAGERAEPRPAVTLTDFDSEDWQRPGVPAILRRAAPAELGHPRAGIVPRRGEQEMGRLEPAQHVVDQVGREADLLAGLALARVLAFDEAAETGWSVVVKGTAERVYDAALTDRYEGLGLRSWADPGGTGQWVRIRPSEVSGRELRPAPD